MLSRANQIVSNGTVEKRTIWRNWLGLAVFRCTTWDVRQMHQDEKQSEYVTAIKPLFSLEPEP